MNRTADRNLLFGILAVQMDFISRDTLIDALQAWLLDKSKPLGQILVERGELSNAKRGLLEPLVDAHVVQHHGDPAQSLAALSSISHIVADLIQIPDDELQQTITLLRQHCPSLGESIAATDTATIPPGQQRFELLRAHAEGGLGKVWIAKDRELNREVAFKEIKPSHAQDSGSRGRFVLEAEITGGLEHPGIVPIYSLGHHNNGRPFYAMRFIRGDSLKEAIQQFHSPVTRPATKSDPNAPTVIGQDAGRDPVATVARPWEETDTANANRANSSPSRSGERGYVSREAFASVEFRQLLGRFVDVCNAIEYAHSRGVLHRDLKPGNIMLGKYGETLVVDWGLAKATGKADQFVDGDEATLMPSSGSGVEPTQIGSAIGTPAYMSPEQAAGRLDELGPATDVYSLGATLYHVLTGQPPFVGGKLPEILRRVQEGDFPRPNRIGSRTRESSDSAQSDGSLTTSATKIPLSLEAICLKAMSLRPSDRYASTVALAADVERFLADEPVLAHAEPLTIRVRRWVKRHQTLVGSTAAAVLVATVTLSVLVLLVTAKNQQLFNANTQISQQSDQIKNQNATLSETNQQLAVAKTDAEVKRAEAEASAKVAHEQSQLALSTLNSVIFDLSRAFQNVPGGAAVRQRLLTTALEKLEKVSTEFAAKSAVDLNTKVALDEMADTILKLGQSSPVAPRQERRLPNDASPATDDPSTKSAVLLAERLYRRGLEIARQLAAADPNDAQNQRDLAISFHKLGDLYLTLGRTGDALTNLQASFDVFRVLAEADPLDAMKQRDLSISLERLGKVFLTLGRTDDALAQFEAKLKINRVLVGADPNDAQNQRDLAISFLKLGHVFLKLGRTDDALTQFQDGLKICRVLAEANPHDSQKQRDLAASFNNLGDLFLTVGRTDDAFTQFQASSDIFRVLTEADPHDTKKQRDLSVSFNKLGNVFLALGRGDDALTQYQNGLMISRVLAEADPHDAQKQRDLSLSFYHLGDAFLTLDRTDDALTQFQDGLKISRVLAEADPNDAQKQHDLSISFEQLGDVFLKLGRTADALTQFQDRLKISLALSEADPRDAQKQRDLSVSIERLGDVFMILGQTDDAFTQFQDELKIRHALANDDPNNAEAQRDLWVVHYKLGQAHAQATQFDQARERFAQSIAVLDGMIAKGQSVKLAEQEKVMLEEERQFCTFAKLAITDWNALLRVDAKVLPRLLLLRATEMLKRGELALAVQAGDKLRELEPKHKNNFFNAACIYARCAEHVTKNKPAPTDAERAERQKFLKLALDGLKESLAAGWDDFAHMKKDDDLKPLRGLPEFEALFPKP